MFEKDQLDEAPCRLLVERAENVTCSNTEHSYVQFWNMVGSLSLCPQKMIYTIRMNPSKCASRMLRGNGEHTYLPTTGSLWRNATWLIYAADIYPCVSKIKLWDPITTHAVMFIMIPRNRNAEDALFASRCTAFLHPACRNSLKLPPTTPRYCYKPPRGPSKLQELTWHWTLLDENSHPHVNCSLQNI